MNTKSTLLIPVLALIALAVGCSDDNPLAPFEPEIVNNADAFQFQITSANDVTVTNSYSWANPTTGASIDHSTARTGGSATLVVLDGEGAEVYRGPMIASGSELTDTGASGNWTVQVIFSSFDGTANFRLEKL